MKAVVRKRFGDKYTGEVYEAGSVLELTPERYAEIRATDTGLIVAVAEDPEEEQTAGQQGAADPENEEQTAGQQGAADPENEEQTAGQQGAADPESEEKTEGQQEAAGQKPKRTKKQAKQDE